MLRRDFLARLATGGASVGLGASAFAYTKKKTKAPSLPNKLDRIAISTWSLHNYFRGTRARDFNLPGSLLALLDFPEMIVDRYKVHHFDVYTSHFPSTEPTYLRELKYALVHTLSTIVNVSVDIEDCGPEGAFSDADPKKRRAALDAVKPWVDVAHALGVRSVQVGPGKVDPENLAPTAGAYKALAIYAQAKGVQVLVENEGGFGVDNPDELVKLFNLTGPGRIGALPNLANFPDEEMRQRGLKMLFPYAHTLCHAKSPQFEAAGAEQSYGFPEALAIARKAGFRGVYSIEFDGPGDPYDGIQKTLDELLKYL
jgi:sugar phosphate isomerase/epimerase